MEFKFGVLTAVNMKITAFRDVVTGCLLDYY
jgi:hypothetical protein